MDFTDDAFVLSARAHGDTGVVVELLTAEHGRRAAYVAGGASRRMKPFLQPGARVVADYRARTSDHLGSARLEPVGEGPSALFDDPLALTGHFLVQFVFHPLDKPLPPARVWMIDKLREAGRL